MLKKSMLISLAAIALYTVGCASAGSRLTGFIYSDTVEAGGATSEASGSKTGEACASSILGVVATGDASVDAAKKAGGISKVSSVDHKNSNILGFYATTCTVVKGN